MGIILSKRVELSTSTLGLTLHEKGDGGHLVSLILDGLLGDKGGMSVGLTMDTAEWHKVLQAITAFDVRTAITKTKQQDADEAKCTDCDGELDHDSGFDIVGKSKPIPGSISTTHQAYVRTIPDMQRGPSYKIMFVHAADGETDEVTGDWSGSRELAIKKMHELVEAGAVMKR